MYKQIKSETGIQVPTSTPKGLKRLVKKSKVKEGVFTCICPSGNIHKWEVKSTGTHVSKGRTVKKVKVGKGVNMVNYALVFKGVVSYA